MFNKAITVLAFTAISGPAQAAFISSEGLIEFSFDGQVGQVGTDQFEVFDRDQGRNITFNRSDVPGYPVRAGDALSLSFRVTADAAKLNNAACGGRFNIIRGGFRGGSNGPCTLNATASIQTASVNSILGNVTNSENGDGQTFIRGLTLVRDDNDRFSLDIADQGYSLSAIELPGVTFDSATNKLGAAVNCGDAFRCPTDQINGTADSLSLESIGIFGDFGTFRPGFNVGYNAGSWGAITINGGFQGIGLFGNNPPSPVPAPSALLLLGVGAGAMVWLRRKRISK